MALTLALVSIAAAATAAYTLVSVDHEIAIGRAALAAVRRDVPMVGDAEVGRYVESLGRRLAAHASGPRYPYVFVVANRRELDAFALPGGPIVINRGALEGVGDEAQPATIVAHVATHPAPAEQLARLRRAVARLGPGRRDSAAFRRMRARLRTVAAPARRSTATPHP